MKKGDDVGDYEDDDAVRTSVSQDRVTETLGHMLEGGMDTQHNKFSSPSWVSHLPAGHPYDLQGFR
jgi:hypothetical protein